MLGVQNQESSEQQSLSSTNLQVDITTEETDIPEVIPSSEVDLTSIEQEVAFTQSITAQLQATFEGAVTFISNVVFKGPVEFFGQVFFRDEVIFNTDTAGFVTISAGNTNVDITFDSPYSVIPVVTATLYNSQAELAWYTVNNITERGFSIEMSQPIGSDVTFSWIALAVEDTNTQHVQSLTDTPPTESKEETQSASDTQEEKESDREAEELPTPVPSDSIQTQPTQTPTPTEPVSDEQTESVENQEATNEAGLELEEEELSDTR